MGSLNATISDFFSVSFWVAVWVSEGSVLAISLFALASDCCSTSTIFEAEVSELTEFAVSSSEDSRKSESGAQFNSCCSLINGIPAGLK